MVLVANRFLKSCIVFIILIVNIFTIHIVSEEIAWWDDDWSFRQELQIPIDTSTEQSKYQPIDMKVFFHHPCWVNTTEKHSIRVVMHKENYYEKLECQIYDLQFSNYNIIEICKLIFLIPESADGSETYFVYYDDTEKSSPNYPDRVHIENGHYYFEPIPGIPFESFFYKIIQDNNIVYGISKQGSFLGSGTSQQVTLFEENTRMVSNPKDVVAFASFDYYYNYGKDPINDFSSTLQDLTSNKIIIDGNLMVECGIESTSKKADFTTIAIYKYYYCPTEHKRMIVHVHHEALKPSKVIDYPILSDSNGNIAGIQVIKMSSPSIQDLNFGKMYPFMHVYNENEVIQEYNLDMDPEYTSATGTRIITTEDDVDLGKRSWASIDDGKEGLSHSIIFDSNSVVKSGTDESQGIQFFAYVASLPGALGFEGDLQSLFFSRNFIDTGNEMDLTIPEDFVIEYNAEFFSTKQGGYPQVAEEAELFQTLIKLSSAPTDQFEQNKETKGDYDFTAYVHLSPSMPFGAYLSILFGLNFSYVAGELYKDGEPISTGIAKRLGVNLPSFSESTPLEKIKQLITFFDYRNASIIKTIKFQNLETGKYLVKIYRENPFLGKQKKFVGYSVVEVPSQDKTHIFCSPQGSIKITVNDQNQRPVANVKALLLLQKKITISESTTSDEGRLELYVPCNFKDSLDLIVMYNGATILNEKIRLSVLNSFTSLNRNVDLDRYDLTVRVLDTWGLPPSYKINPILASDQLSDPNWRQTAKRTDEKEFLFEHLTPSEYQLEIEYKSTSLSDSILITSSDEQREYIFPIEHRLEFRFFTQRGLPLNNLNLKITRENKEKTLSTNTLEDNYIFLPPGTYKVSIFSEKELIGQRIINVIDDTKFDFLTIETSVIPLSFISIILFAFLVTAYLFLRKNDYNSFLTLIPVALILLSLALPWWSITSVSDDLYHSTNLYLLPPELSTLTITQSVIAGERNIESLPDIFSTILIVFIFVLSLSFLCMSVSIFLDKKNKKRSSTILLILSLIILLISLISFFVGISALSEIGVGSFFGEGDINVRIPGEYASATTHGYWGPNISFYILISTSLITTSILFYRLRKKSVSN